jgi:alpha-L-rhamnosidase
MPSAAPAMPATLPANHPLRSARWLWPGGFTYLVNSFAQFRKDFTLETVPKKAPFAITADQHYRLWVNGRYVTRGPARGYQESWPFDEVDLAPYLQRGANWIAVEAYNPGISTFRYLHRTAAGLLCAGRWGKMLLVSDATWQARRGPAQREHTARLSLQLDFQEHIDAAADDRSWITAPTAPTGWTNDRKHYCGDGKEAVAFSRPPWDAVEPRGIPQLAEAERPLAGLLSRATGISSPDWRTWENVSWPFVEEGRTASWTAANDAAQRDGWLDVPMPATGPEGWSAATCPVGEFVFGSLQIEVQGAAGNELIDLHYHESLVGLRGELRKPGDNCLIALASRLKPACGSSRHDFYHLLGFGVVTVVVRGSLRPLTVRLRVRTAGYPFAMRGRFAASDTLLNDIHAACRRTQQVCASDAYVDTPWREQAQWWGDARVQAANTFHLDGDARLLARGIRSIAGQPGPGGLTYGHAPTIAYNCILPDFSLTWLLTIRDHWWQTGDTTLVREMWPRIGQVLGYFDAPAARHSSGLLAYDRRFWLFEDWSTLWKGDVPTFLNLWYLHAIRELTACCIAAGMRNEARDLRKRADRHEALVQRKLFDRKRRLWLAGLDAPSGKESVHDQVLGMILGLEAPAHDSLIEAFLLPYLRGETLPGPVPSAFWSHYVLQLAGDRGHGAACIDFIRRKWQPMLATGTTWEDFAWSESGGGTASHAWTAHPSVHLPRILCGIRQLAPAWAKIEIAPQPIAGIDHAEALVPTPNGDIDVRWGRRAGAVHLDVRIPRTIAAEVRLGNEVRRITGRTTVKLRS